METFSQFLSEETTEDYKVVILTVEVGDKSKTATKFEEQAKKMGAWVFGAQGEGWKKIEPTPWGQCGDDAPVLMNDPHPKLEGTSAFHNEAASQELGALYAALA